MRKPLPLIGIIIFFIFIVISIAFPPRNFDSAVLTSSVHKPSAEPVIYKKNKGSASLIDGLAVSNYVAHRGAPTVSKEPENSLPAYRASKKLGFKIVETDLQLTKDGQWVIMHDYTLDRTTNGKGTVKSKTLKEIKRLTLKGSSSENLSAPTLEEFLYLCSSEELIPILDIKPSEKELRSEDYNSLLILLNKYDLLDKSIFTSSSKEVLTELRNRDDVTAIAVMMEASQENLDFTRGLSNAFIYTSHDKLTDENIELIQNNGLKFGVWTINDEKVAKHFKSKGAIMIVTDEIIK